MSDTPCRVSADLRRYEAEQDENERRYQQEREQRRGECYYECMDGTELKKHLNDDLHHPLAELFRCYETGGDCKDQIKKLRERVISIMLGDE